MEKLLKALMYASRSEKNRKMVFGEYPFICVQHWMAGFRMGQLASGHCDMEEHYSFLEFIFQSLNEPISGMTPIKLIIQKTNSDEEAYSLFFSIVQEYCRIKGLSFTDERYLRFSDQTDD